MLNSGKLVLVGMITLAVVLATIAVWHRRESTRRPLELWGAEAAGLIAGSSRAELLVLSGVAGAEGDYVEHKGSKIAVQQRYDLKQVRGLVHLRAALVEDASFHWGEQSECQPVWQYGLQFIEGDRQAIVLLDLDCGVAAVAGRDEIVSIRPIAAGLKQVIAEVQGEQ